MSEGDSPRPVELRTRFDQFPATIKGAFVLQGADGNPHAVDIQRCEVARIPTGPTRPLPVEARVDVAPGRDLFVPFETAIGDLEPGWYALHSTIRVDAGGTWSFSSRGFVVPWPRDQVRRGTVKVGAAVGAGPEGLVIEAVEMRGDCTIVSWHPAGSGGEDRPKRGPRMRLLPTGARSKLCRWRRGRPVPGLPRLHTFERCSIRSPERRGRSGSS